MATRIRDHEGGVLSHEGLHVTHLPQNAPWYLFAGIFSTATAASVRKLEILWDSAKAGTDEGEYSILLKMHGVAGGKAVQRLVTGLGAQARSVTHAEGMELCKRFFVPVEHERMILAGFHSGDRQETPVGNRSRTEEGLGFVANDGRGQEDAPVKREEDPQTILVPVRSDFQDDVPQSQDSFGSPGADRVIAVLSEDSDGGQPGDETENSNCDLEVQHGSNEERILGGGRKWQDVECGKDGSVRINPGRSKRGVKEDDVGVGEEQEECSAASLQGESEFASEDDVLFFGQESIDDSTDEFRLNPEEEREDDQDEEEASEAEATEESSGEAESVEGSIWGMSEEELSEDTSSDVDLATRKPGKGKGKRAEDVRTAEDAGDLENVASGTSEEGCEGQVPIEWNRNPMAAVLDSGPGTRIIGSPFCRTRTANPDQELISGSVSLRNSFHTSKLRQEKMKVAPANPDPLAVELFEEMWNEAENRVRGSSEWYQMPIRQEARTKILEPKHYRYLVTQKKKLVGAIGNPKAGQEVADAFSKHFGLQRMHISTLLACINSNVLEKEYRVKLRAGVKHQYTHALSNVGNTYEILSDVLLLLIDAIRKEGGVEELGFDPDTLMTLQDFRHVEWLVIMAHVVSDRAGVCIRPHRLMEHVKVSARDINVQRIMNLFTGRRSEQHIQIERFAGGSRFAGGAMQADLKYTDSLPRPVGLSPAERDLQQDADLCFANWVEVGLRTIHSASREARLLKAGREALPGCRIRLRSRHDAREPLSVRKLQDCLDEVIELMSPNGLRDQEYREFFQQVVVIKLQFRSIYRLSVDKVEYSELEFWFADRGHTAIANHTLGFWAEKLPLKDPRSVELNDNESYLHPLCCLQTSFGTKYPLYYLQGAMGITGQKAQPMYVRPIRVIGEGTPDTRYVFKVGYSSPIDAATMIGEKVKVKTNVLKHESPKTTSPMKVYIPSYLPPFCQLCGFLGHDKRACVQAGGRRGGRCVLCRVGGLEAVEGHDEQRCPTREDYFVNSKLMATMMMKFWERETVFGLTQRQRLKQMFADHGLQSEMYMETAAHGVSRPTDQARRVGLDRTLDDREVMQETTGMSSRGGRSEGEREEFRSQVAEMNSLDVVVEDSDPDPMDQLRERVRGKRKERDVEVSISQEANPMLQSRTSSDRLSHCSKNNVPIGAATKRTSGRPLQEINVPQLASSSRETLDACRTLLSDADDGAEKENLPPRKRLGVGSSKRSGRRSRGKGNVASAAEVPSSWFEVHRDE